MWPIVIANFDFTASIEKAVGRVWVHNKVYRYNKTVKNKIKDAIAHLHRVYGPELWCLSAPMPVDPKFHKYVTQMGFRFSGLEENGDGLLCNAYVKRDDGKLSPDN